MALDVAGLLTGAAEGFAKSYAGALEQKRMGLAEKAKLLAQEKKDERDRAEDEFARERFEKQQALTRELAEKKMEQERELKLGQLAAREAKAAAGTGGGLGAAAKPSKVQELIDKQAAEGLAKWEGFEGESLRQKSLSNIKTIDDAIAKMRTRDDISGPLMGQIPEFARKTVFPTSAAVEQDLKMIMQGTLRETLGGQFAMKEGERIEERTFDARLPEEENIKKAMRIRDGIAQSVKAKDAAYAYLRENGTMRGYRGPSPEQAYYSALGEKMPEGATTDIGLQMIKDNAGGMIPQGRMGSGLIQDDAGPSPEEIEAELKRRGLK